MTRERLKEILYRLDESMPIFAMEQWLAVAWVCINHAENELNHNYTTGPP